MGGHLIDDDDWELSCPVDVARTLVLVGRTGNGKSATGNTITGRKAFKSRCSSSGVTTTCELQQSVLPDGQIVNVIDTPGLFDISIGPDFISKEIIKCIDQAKDGIHAVLLVLSVKTRFSEEEEAAVRSLITLFGNKIVNYMIVVFTNGDALEENDETLEDDYLRDCSPPLKDILSLCENRMVLFNNKTKDERKRIIQVQQLLSLVDTVVDQNDGKPYTDDLFVEMQKTAKEFEKQQQEVKSKSLEGCSEGEILNLGEQVRSSYEEQLKRITEMVEERLSETTRRLELKLAEEQAARLIAEDRANEAQMKSSHEIRKLRESLERARKETDHLRKQAESKCAIL